MSMIMKSWQKEESVVGMEKPQIRQQLNHFSHRHPLERSEIQEEDKAICSGCEHDTIGPAYICTKPNCIFLLHDLCFDLPRQIRHPSHPKHPLHLHFSPPYGDGEFVCDACGNSGHAFTYHCASCNFDLHVECASLPEIETREDHEHPLVLFYGSQENVEGTNCLCYVCNDPIAKGGWSYCCLSCNNCGTHVNCVSN